MSNNETTRRYARLAMHMYAANSGWTAEQVAEDPETLLSDFLADLHYTADEDGVDYYMAVTRAAGYRNDPEDQDT